MKKLSLPVLYGLLAFTIAIMFAFKPEGTRHDAARVNQYGGYYVFTDCNPEAEYKVLGTIKPKGRGWQAIGVTDVQYNDMREGLIKACKKDYPEADGIIIHLGGNNESDAIKFK